MSIAEPAKIITPWADTGSKNPIPQNSNNATGAAGYDKGFPDITMTPPEAGGIPPAGQDFNGIFYEVTKILRYMQAGGQPTFSTTLASGIGGYPVGAMVLGDDGVAIYTNRVDGNSSNPNSGGSGWAREDLMLREALRRSYAEAGYNLVGGSFEAGGTLGNANDVLLQERTGKAFSGPAGAVAAGTDPTSGGFVDRSMEYLRSKSASGVSLSHVMHLPSPLETALELHREFGVELIIDCDCEYSYMLIKPGDSIRCVGWPTLTKIDNSVPSIAATQAPERPIGYFDNFNVNAFFVVYHPDNSSAGHISITGGIEFMAGPSITLEKYAHIPRMSFSKLTDIRMQSHYASTTMDGIVFKDEYTNTIGDIHLIGEGMCRYGFLWEDFYSGNYYSTGTSTNGYGLRAVNFRRPFRMKWHNYSRLTVCGGETVGIKDELGAPMQPLVFDIEDSLVTLDTPSTEGLYGSFIKVSRTAPLTPANCVILNPQANASIYGSKDDTTCKLINVTGGAEVVINGGFMTQAAAGYNLHFGGAATDSVLQCNGLHTDFIIDSIRNDPANYGGCHEFNGQMLKFMTKMWGRTGPYSIDGQIPFEHTEYDPYALKTGYSSVTIRRGGFYSVKGSIRTSDADGYLTIKFNGTERARTYFTQSPTTPGEQTSSYIDFDGFIDSGVVVSLEVHFDNSGIGIIVGNDWYDNKFTVELK